MNRFSEYRDYSLFLIYMYDSFIFDLMTLKSKISSLALQDTYMSWVW